MKIGITGHQRLGDPAAWEWVEAAIRDELSSVNPPRLAVTSLAIGADQLLARLVIEHGGQVHAVLPFADCERTFSPHDLPEYRRLLAASSVEVLTIPGSDEDAYLAAGKRVADLSDLMFAVWNALPAKGKGGTADVVEYALQQGKALIHINPVQQTIVRHQSRH